MLEFIDGFDHYSNATGLRRKWDSNSAQNGTMSFVAGRFGGNATAWSAGGTPLSLSQGQLAAVQTRIVGFAMQLSTLVEGWTFFQFLDGSNTQVDLRFHSNGQIYVTRNGTVLGSSTYSVQTGAWFYLEVQATISTTTGAIQVNVSSAANAGTWISLSNVNTQATSNATTNGVAWQSPAANPMAYTDDVYILNTSGSTNNAFLGEVRVATLFPTADGTNLQFTPDSGTAHFSRVNETTPDDDTSYVYSSTPGQIDTYAVTALPAKPVFGVQITLTARKDDASVRSICAEYRRGGTNYDGANTFVLTSNYTVSRQLYDTDPANAGAAFTSTGINAAEFGVKCVA
jgi:hypothetical protein